MPSFEGRRRHTDPDWLSKMANNRGDLVKLAGVVVAAIFLLVWLGTHLGGGPDKVTEDVKFDDSPADEIREDPLPFRPARTPAGKGRTEPGGEFPYGPEALEAINHKSRSLESEAYYYLAHHVMNRSQPELKAEAEIKTEWVDVFKRPAEHCGRTLRITGELVRLRQAPLPKNPCGLKVVYQGQLVDKHFRFWTFVLLEKPSKDIGLGDSVRVYGPFFKIWEYETNLPNAMKLSAVVVGKRLVRVKFDEPPVMGPVLVVLTMITICVLVVAGLVARSGDTAVAERRRTSVASRRPAGLGEMAKALSAKVAEENAERFRPAGAKSTEHKAEKPQDESLKDGDGAPGGDGGVAVQEDSDGDEDRPDGEVGGDQEGPKDDDDGAEGEKGAEQEEKAQEDSDDDDGKSAGDEGEDRSGGEKSERQDR